MKSVDLDYLAGEVSDLLVQANKVVVFTGAGVSTESGIPDFRSPGGIWSRYDPEDFTIQKFLRYPENRKKQWQMLTEGGLLADAEPNPAHYAVAELDRLGKLDCVITQNVDNLHQKAGVPAEKVFELHGNMRFVRCLSCNKIFPIEDILKRLEDEDIPDCEYCHGILKPDAVFFGEALPQRALNDAVQHSRQSDLFIVIGSTLIVYPAAYMPVYARESGAKLVIINLSSTPMDPQATVLISSKAGEAMEKIMEKARGQLSA